MTIPDEPEDFDFDNIAKVGLWHLRQAEEQALDAYLRWLKAPSDKRRFHDSDDAHLSDEDRADRHYFNSLWLRDVSSALAKVARIVAVHGEAPRESDALDEPPASSLGLDRMAMRRAREELSDAWYALDRERGDGLPQGATPEDWKLFHRRREPWRDRLSRAEQNYMMLLKGRADQKEPTR